MYFYLLAWRHYADFSGTASRREFWMFMLINILISLMIVAMEMTVDLSSWVDLGYSLISFIPTLSIITRRLHDLGRSGWWGMIVFVPVVGVIWLVYLLVQPSYL